MKPVKINIEDFRLNDFINYYEGNIDELVGDSVDIRVGINLIDKDYMDVLHFEEDYEDFQTSDDFKEALLNEDYSLLFTIGRTYEGNEKVELIDGKKYNLTYFQGDLYLEENTIKDIGDLSLDLNHFIGLLVNFENDEIDICAVNYSHGCGISTPSIEEIEETGDLEDIIKGFVDRFRD